jgi:hypothetical protein
VLVSSVAGSGRGCRSLSIKLNKARSEISLKRINLGVLQREISQREKAKEL